MPQTTYEKASTPRSVVYDSLDMPGFDTITVAASQANTAVQALIPLPVNVKVYGAAIVGGTATAGVTSFNVVLGAGAETGVPPSDNVESVGYPPTTAAAGNQLFAADQAVTLVANVTQTFGAAVQDAVWPKGGVLTLRVVSSAGGAGTLKVVLLTKPYDTKPYLPGEANRPIQYSDL